MFGTWYLLNTFWDEVRLRIGVMVLDEDDKERLGEGSEERKVKSLAVKFLSADGIELTGMDAAVHMKRKITMQEAMKARISN